MTDILPIKEWGLFTMLKGPVIICGPCSAENRNMVLDTAAQLHSMGVELFRAGIWKPRTRPNSFEGVGSIGLPWLQAVQKELGMKVAVEVATASHVRLALEAGIDVLWIGARTTANPFAMQEIADALKGNDIPVLVKNPVNPEADLWIGALERLYLVGLRRIAAVHRGFSAYGQSRYRNHPYWQIPAEIKRRIPNISLLCDPSHISGKREYIAEVSAKALSLGFDGLMVEVHNAPDSALSDAAQQITPEEFRQILASLEIRNREIDDKELQTAIAGLRAEIDRLDASLVDILAARMSVVDKIGEYKKSANITVLQTGRWNTVLETVSRLAAEKGLDPHYVERIFKIIHEASIERQM